MASCSKLILIVTTLGIAPCFAQKLAMGEEPIAVVQRLKAQGISQIGELDLGQFERELGTINWTLSDEKFEMPTLYQRGWTLERNASGELVRSETRFPIDEEDRPYRESARYVLGQVTLHESVLELENPTRTQILLHEAFGALGYNDHHSALSGSMMMIHDHPQTLDSLGSAFFNSQSLRAGGSSVGGGGDSVALEIKERVRRSIMRQPVNTNFLANFLSVAFEPMDEPKNQIVMMNYKVNLSKSRPTAREFLGVRQDRAYEELITVYFPRAIWLSQPESRPLIVAAIHLGIISFFPLSTHTEMEPIHGYEGCDGEPLMAPVFRDHSADFVLRFRDFMLSKCHRHRPNSGFGTRNEAGFEVFMTQGHWEQIR